MNELSLIMLGLGVLILVAVYWVSVRRLSNSNSERVNRSQMSQPQSVHQTAVRSGTAHSSFTSARVASLPKPVARRRIKLRAPFSKLSFVTGCPVSGAAVMDPLIIVINVLARDGKLFYAEQLQQCFAALGLQSATQDIFKYYVCDRKPSLKKYAHTSVKQSLFTITNITEPGSFDFRANSHFTTKGLCLILDAPATMDAVQAFEKLLEVARAMALRLDAIVCDDKRNRLTRQTEAYLKEQISEYNLKLRLQQTCAYH